MNNVRAAVAKNPMTPVDALIALAKDEDSDIRWAVTKNPYAFPELLAILAKDKDLGVRVSATRSDNFVPPHIPSKIGNVEITAEQRLALQEGKGIEIKGIKDKAGKLYDTTYVIIEQKTNKIKLLQQQDKNKFQKAQIKSAAKIAPIKRKGIKI
jgi:hypothetical protein